MTRSRCNGNSHHGWHYYTSIHDFDPIGGHKRMVSSCVYCGEVKSLGPSDETLLAVADEIVAAEFAADRRNHKALRGPRACIRGGRPICEVGGCDGCDAWDLARCIVEHQS
jgi:hypothetical protein